MIRILPTIARPTVARPTLPALLAIIPLTACGAGEPSAGAAPVVRDSAGVEIVESAAPVWREDEAWRVSAEPILQIGQVTGEAPYLFDRVLGVVRLEDGGVVVGNMGDNTLRFYDGGGAFVRQAGGSGEVPAEFRQIGRLERRGDRAGSAIGLLRDELLLMWRLPEGDQPHSGVVLDSMPIFRVADDGATSDTILRLPAVHFVNVGSVGVPMRFGGRPE